MSTQAAGSTPKKADLLSAIDESRSSIITLLRDLIRAPSPNPPGDTRAAAAVLTSYLHARSIATSTIAPQAHMPNIVTVLNPSGTGPTLVFNPHIDVFPVSDSDEWQHGPWSGDIADGRIYGRGVVDMKAGTAAQVAAFALLHRFLGPALRRGDIDSGKRVALCCVSDEETGGRWGSKYLLDEDEHKDVWRGNVVLNAEPTGLSSIRFAEKGTLRLTFTVRTKSAHGAYLHLSEGAVRVSARLIVRLLELEQFEDFVVDKEIARHLARKDVRERIDEIMGKGAAEMMTRVTVNVGVIQGGSKVNTIPGLCTFETDIRLPIGLAAESLLQKIQIILQDFPEAEMQVHQAASNPANFNSPDHAIVTAIQRNAEEILGEDGDVGRTPLSIPSMGATDCKHWRYKGIPAYSYGLSPAGMAEKDESVVLDDYIKLVKIQAGVMWDWLTEREGWLSRPWLAPAMCEP